MILIFAKSARRFLCASLFFIVALLSLEVARGAEKKGSFVPPPPPPEAMPLSVKVERGESVRIILHIYGNSSDPVRFRLKSKPMAGTITEPESLTDETAVVVYHHSGAASPLRDHFAYAAQTRAGVSAQADVDIAIHDEPPQLMVPDEVRFGRVFPGEKSERTITIENRGGGLVEGDLEMPSGWRVAGSGEYHLDRGEKQQFTLVFAPEDEREYHGELHFTGDPQHHATMLHGSGVERFAARPSALELKADNASANRSADLDIENRTDEPQSATVEANGKLRVSQQQIELPANGSAKISVSSDEVSAIDEKLTIRVADAQKQTQLAQFAVPVRAPALGAILRTNANRVSLGKVATNETAVGTVRIENLGGTPTNVNVESGQPFSIDESDRAFSLDPGANHVVRVALHPSAPGFFQATLRVTTATDRIELPIDGQGIPTPVSNPAPAQDLLLAQQQQTQAQQNAQQTNGQIGGADAALMSTGARSLSGLHAVAKTIAERFVEMQWPAPQDTGASFHVEMRHLSLDEKRQLKTDWIPLSGAQTQRSGNMISVRVNNLKPGIMYVFRGVLTNTRSGEPEVLDQLLVRTLSKKNSVTVRGVVLTLLLIFAATLIGAMIWQRIAASRPVPVPELKKPEEPLANFEFKLLTKPPGAVPPGAVKKGPGGGEKKKL